MGMIFEIALKIVKSLGWLLLVGSCLVVLINGWVLFTAERQIITIQELSEIDWLDDHVPVLTLGAGVINNQLPSPILANRLDKTLEIYQRNPRHPLIMSGDHKEDNYNEVLVMKQYLEDNGLPSSQIYLDHAGYSTYQSLKRLKTVHRQDKAVIVTQRYHLPRALMLARALGIQAVGIAAEDRNHNQVYREAREVLARIKDFLSTHLNLPLQEASEKDYAIDFSQSGDLTNRKSDLESRW